MKEKYFEINESGNNIRCKLYFTDPKAIKRVIVCAHGFSGHKDNKSTEKLAERILSKKKDVSLISFNWPCHGDDVKKKLTLIDSIDYLDSVIAYAKKEYKTDEIYFYGIALAAGCALNILTIRAAPLRRLFSEAPQ